MSPSPGTAYWRVVEPVWDAIDIYNGPESFLETYAAADAKAARLFAAHFCQSEVRNGGLHQFFGNSTGVLAPEAVEGFRCIGMPDVADLLERAMAWFGPAYPRDRDVRESRLAEQSGEEREDWDPFGALDDQIFEALDGDGDRFELQADEYATRNDN
jgi:hypothetical protein